MIDIAIFDDGFTTMPIHSMDQIANCYQASGGFLLPTEIARHYCDIAFAVGKIMAYGFRRFGYPVNDWDDDKELCQWIVTTPMSGVFLSIKPATVAPFGFLLKKDILTALSEEQNNKLRAWGAACHEWAKTEKQTILIDMAHIAGNYTDEESLIALEAWLTRTYPTYQKEESLTQLAERLGTTKAKISVQFWTEKSVECRQMAAEYAEICPPPDTWRLAVLGDHTPETPFWRELPETSIERQINEAIWRTLCDLKRPVSVRDWALTIDDDNGGEDETLDDGEEKTNKAKTIYDYYAPESPMAGQGVPSQEA